MLAARLPLAEETVMPDAVESFGQHVHEEASDELVRLEGHGSRNALHRLGGSPCR